MRTALLIALLLAGCAHPPQEPAPPGPARHRDTLTLQLTEVPETLELPGTLVPIQQAALATRLSGRITFLRVEEGDHVQKGQLLARIDVEDVQASTVQAQAALTAAQANTRQADAATATAAAAVGQAEADHRAAQSRLPEARAQLELARIEHARTESLYRQDAVAKQQLDHAETNLKVAGARLEQLQANLAQAQQRIQQARAQQQEAAAAVTAQRAREQQAAAAIEQTRTNLAYGEIRAPFDGTVIKKHAYEGELSTPGMPLLELEDTRSFWLEVPVPETALRALKTGQVLKVNGTTEARVQHVVPSADPASRTFIAKLKVDNDGTLISGLYATATIPRGTRRALLIPKSAVVRKGQLEQVELDTGMRLVTTGAAFGDQVEVLTGLKPGDKLLR